MLKHTKIYFDHFHISYDLDGSHTFIACEVCRHKAVDIHHINGRDDNSIEALIALCRDCHKSAHHEGDPECYLSKGDLDIAHRSKLY